MEQIPAGLASFVGHLFVGADNAVANGAFGLAFESPNDIATKCDQPINDASALFWFLHVSQALHRCEGGSVPKK